MDIILKSIDNYLFLYGQHFLSMVFIRMSMGSMGFAVGGDALYGKVVYGKRRGRIGTGIWMA